MPIVSRPGQPDLFYQFDDYTDPWADAPFLILQHGFCRTSQFWYQWVPHLARHFRIIRPDMRGVGRSQRTLNWHTDIVLEKLVADLLAIADHAGARDMHVCGESLGGIIGLATASLAPQRVRSLSLISTPTRIVAAAQERYALGYGSIVAAIEAVGALQWVRTTTASTRFPADAPVGLVDWFCTSLAEAGQDAIVEYSRFLQTADVTPYLAGVKAPVLSLYPSGGTIATADQKTALQEHVPHARFAHINTASHMIQHVMPGVCARQVLQFCAATDGRICEE
jgi:3-oxoadipate enol-lactonase